VITDPKYYDGPNQSIRRKLAEVRSDLRGLSRREMQESRFDNEAAQAIARERANLYLDIAAVVDSCIGLVNSVDKHVAEHQQTQS
jgi:adenylate kinase